MTLRPPVRADLGMRSHARRIPHRTTRPRPELDADERAEADRIAAAMLRGELPPELVRFAEGYARWAAYREWGELDDLLSAALYGAWRAVERCGHLEEPIDYWKPWVASFVRSKLLQVRRDVWARARVRRACRVATGRTKDVGSWVADPKPTDPVAEAERPAFWERAVQDLTPLQADILLLVHRYELSTHEANRKHGGGDSIATLNRAYPTVVRNLRPYRETMPFPSGRRRSSARSGGALPEHVIDGELYTRCLAVLPPGEGRCPRRRAGDLRGVFSAMRYRWTVGTWETMPPHLPGKGLVKAWLNKWRHDENGSLEKLREILAPQVVESLRMSEAVPSRCAL